MNYPLEPLLQAARRAIDQGDLPIDEALRHFGEGFLSFIYSPEVQANRRLAIAAAGKTDLGPLMYERGVLRSQRLVTDFIRTAMSRGQLRNADPDLATKQLYALLEAELIDLFLFQLAADVPKETIRAMTARALEVFLAAYGPR